MSEPKIRIKLKVPVEWKRVTGYPDYEVSNYGQVKSYRLDPKGRLRKKDVDQGGYERVTLYHADCGRRSTTKQIPRMVAEAFLPYPSNKIEDWVVNLRDHSKTNNFVGNLCWVPKSDHITNWCRIGRQARQ